MKLRAKAYHQHLVSQYSCIIIIIEYSVCYDIIGGMGVNWLYFFTAAVAVGICFFVITGIFTFFIKRYRSKRLLITRYKGHN